MLCFVRSGQGWQDQDRGARSYHAFIRACSDRFNYCMEQGFWTSIHVLLLAELEVKEYQKQVDKGDGNFTIDGLMTVMISSWKSLEEEEEAILSAFRVFDKENTGRIDADELRHIFVTLGDALTQEEVRK